jgi:hypothetical protein
MVKPPTSPEGLDEITLLGFSGGAKMLPKKVTYWHIRVNEYAPLGTQPGETLDEAIGNLIGKWNGMGGFVYESDHFVKDADGWLYTRTKDNLRVYGQKFEETIYVADTEGL